MDYAHDYTKQARQEPMDFDESELIGIQKGN